MKFSIVVPVYNTEPAYFHQCMESILGQDYRGRYAYLEYFYANYTDNLSVLQYEPADLEGLEYRQIASYYNTKLIQLKNYVNGRIDENKSFISDDGITFQDIGARIDNLLQINLANFRSFVTEKGVYKNRQAYVDLLDYKNYKDRNIYSINTKTYGLYKSCIDRYDPKMTGVVLVPSVDKNQDFYMSKTKTGIDHLAEYAVDAEEIAEKKQSDIKNRQSIIDHISVSVNQADDLIKAEGMIQAIDLELRDISRQAVQIDMEYSRYKNKDCVVLSIDNLREVNRAIGYAAGDKILEEIGDTLKALSREYGFIGYNGANQFLCLLDNCTGEKAEFMLSLLSESIKQFNEGNPGVMIEMKARIADSKKTGIYQINKLISKAYEMEGEKIG